MAKSPFHNQQVAEVNVSNAIYNLPNASATTTAQAKANLLFVMDRIADQEPGHRMALGLDTMGHPAMLSVSALLKKVHDSIV